MIASPQKKKTCCFSHFPACMKWELRLQPLQAHLTDQLWYFALVCSTRDFWLLDGNILCVRKSVWCTSYVECTSWKIYLVTLKFITDVEDVAVICSHVSFFVVKCWNIQIGLWECSIVLLGHSDWVWLTKDQITVCQRTRNSSQLGMKTLFCISC